ncbi:MAG TPA: glycosyltransferase family 4 protein [Verrucomicrobiae bacterium]|nr:glycosyltransferase family 4 protein [Verrucomicrobiae bacterium]
MKRVLIFSTAYLPLMGGAEVAIREITDRATDFDFDLVCAKLKPGLASREIIGRVRVHRLGFGQTIDKYLLPLLAPVYALRFKPDLIWSMQASYAGFASLFYSWLKPKTRYLLTLQEGDPFERYEKHAGPFAGLHRKIFQRPDAIQVISGFLGDWATNMGFEGTPKLVPNGVDVSRFTYRQPQPAQDFTIVHHGRLTHKNGMDLLIRALPMVPTNVTLRLIGDGEDKEMLVELARTLGVSDRVEFAGTKSHEEIAKAFHQSQLFCRPSRTEGLGNSFLEAMSAGLPTIGTPVGGIPDFLTDETGWLCQPESPDALAETINRVLTTPKEEILRVTENAAKLVREYYNWERVGRDMSALFAQTIVSKRILIASGIYPPESGGPAQYSFGFKHAVERLGHVVRVVAYGEMPGRVSRRGGGVLRYLRFGRRVGRLAGRFDVIFLQGAVSEGYPATIAARRTGTPTVLRVPGDYAWEMAQQNGDPDLLDAFLTKTHSGKIGLFEKMERFTAKNACRVIAPSAYLKTVVERWGVPADKIAVIRNAEQNLPFTHARDEARAMFGVSDKVVCLTVCRAVPWKGVAALIDAWNDLPASHVLVVGGDGPEYEKWKRLAEPLGERVRFVGRLDRAVLADWYRASDAFLLNSGYEGYPHVVAEAASLGVPCFVSDQGGNPETKEVFGDLITVLPYLEKTAWVNALADVNIRKEHPLSAPCWDHHQMIADVMDVLNLCAS